LLPIAGRDNKASLGFVDVLNNKIRGIQRRAYGLHDKHYLWLKVLTCMLPPAVDSTPSRATPRILPGAAAPHHAPWSSADRACDAADIAVDMMDDESTLPKCPQRSTTRENSLRKFTERPFKKASASAQAIERKS
jgi:hypothetical protein